MAYHVPVMLKPCVDALRIMPNGIYVDATFGGGGHSSEILKSLENGRLYGFDQDKEAGQNSLIDTRFTLIQQNFKFLKNFLNFYKVVPVDGILADLGVSSYQFDQAERGFSTRFDGPLDMRMDTGKGQTAADLLNTIELQALTNIFRNYGELQNAYKSAQAVIAAREKNPLMTTLDLKKALSECAPRGRENKYFAQVFQSIRIELNQELESLKSLLSQSLEVLKPGGRLVVMSYHSLEDRLVKNFMKSGNFEGEIKKDFFGQPLVPFTLVNRKPQIATDEEVEQNPRARSAKLRIAEKL
jgi:16S rRNA (cytosine1402-N4)-methyltransferase